MITDNLIPSLEGSGFSGWRVVESQDTGFKTNQLYQASEINNHEFTGNVAFEAVWDINMYTVNVEMVDKEVPANVLDSKLWSRCPLGRDPEADGRKQYKKTAHLVNQKLKKLGMRLGLSIPLTTYVARHAWASIAKSKNISLSVISEAMGHDSENTTRIYLASLDTSLVDKANSLILKSL